MEPMKMSSAALIILSVLICFSPGLNGQSTFSLPRSIPESEGVTSQGITEFLDAATKSRHEFHSFMFLRHGKVIAEGWWNPYRPELKHTLYSTSKSFTATAIGFAVSEKLLTVNDKVISFFPGDLPEPVSPFLMELTIKDLLTMSVGQDPDPTFQVVASDNWVKAFLSTPIVNKPGTKFLYNSTATYMLSAIIQKVTGLKLIEYLKPRLFDPLGIQGMDWEIDPARINSGGWGLRLKTEDLAKFGQLFLQKGKWNGQQILPATWVEEATTMKIIQNPGISKTKRDSSDWEQGYCYQMWRCRHNAYRGDGAYGQFIIVLPDEDAVIAITAETSDMQDEINLVWKYLLPSMHPGKLPLDKNKEAALKKQLASLSLPVPEKGNASSLQKMITGKTFRMQANERQFEKVTFSFKTGICTLSINTGTGVYPLSFGSGSWSRGQTFLPGPTLFSGAKALFAGLPAFQVMGCYRWKDENTLELTLRYIESPHHEQIICHFEDDKMTMEIHNSTDASEKKSVLSGKWVK